MENKCRKCRACKPKESCNFKIITVTFDEEFNCNICRELCSIKEAANIMHKPTFLIPASVYGCTVNKLFGYRVDSKNGFIIVYARNIFDITCNDILKHYEKWANNKIINGRFSENICGDRISSINNYIPDSSSARRYANILEKSVMCKVSLIRELYNTENNNRKFHNKEYFDINKPVYCLCGKKLELKYESMRSEDMYAICECGLEYSIFSNNKYILNNIKNLNKVEVKDALNIKEDK